MDATLGDLARTLDAFEFYTEDARNLLPHNV